MNALLIRMIFYVFFNMKDGENIMQGSMGTERKIGKS